MKLDAGDLERALDWYAMAKQDYPNTKYARQASLNRVHVFLSLVWSKLERFTIHTEQMRMLINEVARHDNPLLIEATLKDYAGVQLSFEKLLKELMQYAQQAHREMKSLEAHPNWDKDLHAFVPLVTKEESDQANEEEFFTITATYVVSVFYQGNVDITPDTLAERNLQSGFEHKSCYYERLSKPGVYFAVGQNITHAGNLVGLVVENAILKMVITQETLGFLKDPTPQENLEEEGRRYLNKVLQLTESDPYNKCRFEAKRLLKENK